MVVKSYFHLTCGKGLKYPVSTTEKSKKNPGSFFFWYKHKHGIYRTYLMPTYMSLRKEY